MRARLVLFVALCLAATGAAAQPTDSFLDAAARAGGAVTLPDGFYLDPVATGLDTPVAAAVAPDGRVFVAEKEGRLVSVGADGARVVLLDLTAEVLEHGDRGMLGLTLDPAFSANGYVYLVYTVSRDGGEGARTDAFSRLTRYTVGPGGSVAPASRRVLLGETFATGIPACYYSHAIGTLAWGRDGTLFVGAGDAAHYGTTDTGGLYGNCFSAGRVDPADDIGAFRSQRVESLAGKILRLDPATGLGLPSNPFYTGNPADNASRVWAMGFRNPFRFGTDPASGSTDPTVGDPGLLYVGDVGWNTWEELTLVRRGDNAGWPCREGASVLGSYANSPRGQATCPGRTFTDPVSAWHHRTASQSSPPGRTAAAIVGGPVVRGTRYPVAYRGRAFYGDAVGSWVASGVAGGGSVSGDVVFSGDLPGVVQIGQDDGFLTFVNIATGTVSRLRHTDEATNSAPVAQAGANVTQGGAPLAVQFSGSASFDPDGDAIAIAWTFGDGGTSAEANPAHVYVAPGTYTARLTVTDVYGAASSATVAILVQNGTAPTATIAQPTDGTLLAPGQTLALVGEAFDPEQPAATLDFRWDVTLVHNTHQHPNDFSATGASTVYTVPFHGDSGDTYAIRLTLTVTDATGLVGTDERFLLVSATAEVDVTASGRPTAFVMAPIGAGSRSLEALRDGMEPAATTSSNAYATQYDTFTGSTTRALDWIGYTFASARTFRRVHFVEGLQYVDGGWFETLGVEVRQDGTWRAVTGLTVTPQYGGADGRHFDAYRLAFEPMAGDGIRIVGVPGGSKRFVSAAELRVFALPGGDGALPDGWSAADVGATPPGGSVYVVDSAGGMYTVRGGGDLWGDFDGFHFAHRALVGDGEVVARLTSVAGANPWAKAGLMVRASTDPAAPHAMMIGTPGQGLHFQYRRTAGGETEWQPGPGAADGGTLPAWLRLVREGSALRGYRSADGQTWTLVGETTIAMGAEVRVGLVATSTDFTGRGDLATATFTDVHATGESVPDAWVSGDIGPVNAVGSFTLVGTGASVEGSGDLWGDLDGFHFAHQPLASDGVVTARLESLAGVHPWAKAGLMLRATDAPDAPYVSLTGTSARGVHMQFRTATGGPTDWVMGDEARRLPVWLRLQRAGTAVTGYVSADGQTWAAVGTAPFAAPAARAGLAVTSTDYEGRGDLARAVFSGVAVAGGTASLIDAPLLNGLRTDPPPFEIVSVAPNPTRGAAVVRVGIARPGVVRAETFDVLGRRVAFAEAREDVPGVRALPLDLRGLAPGVYVLRVSEAGGASLVRRLTVVR